MMNVKVLADTTFYKEVNGYQEDVERVVTYQVKLPKRLLQELNTHGTVARNAASMRAIPAKRFRESANCHRVFWGENQPGMQSETILDPVRSKDAWTIVENLRQTALATHEKLENLGVHKQHSNPYLEPWAFADAIITLTSKQMDFFYLRANEATEPDFAYVATRMLEEWIKGRQTTTFKKLSVGFDSVNSPMTSINMGEQVYVDVPENLNDLHLPFGIVGDHLETLAANVAGVARVSYMNHEGKYDREANLKLFLRLFKSGHMSPFEHVCWGQEPALGRHNRMSEGIQTLRFSIEQINKPYKLSLGCVLRKMKKLCLERGYNYPEWVKENEDGKL